MVDWLKSEKKVTDKRNDAAQEKGINNADYMKAFQIWLGLLHEGISQLSGKAQDIMLHKCAEGAVEGLTLAMKRMYNCDPKTFNVDEMIKHHEPIENQFAKGKASITREGNIITWKSNVSYCYDPKIEHGMIKPYPAFCKQCNLYFFELLYGMAHKGPVKVSDTKGVLNGDDECFCRIELL